MELERIKSQYSTIYITVVSIFLGIALEDLASIFRSVENPGLYEWIALFLIISLALNTWISYSSFAISVRLIPVPMDAINVFIIIIGQFIFNTLILYPAYILFYANAIYNIGAAIAVFYNANRASQDKESTIKALQYRPLIQLNVIISGVSVVIALSLQYEWVGPAFEKILICSILLHPIIWLFLFWRIWKRWILSLTRDKG